MSSQKSSLEHVDSIIWMHPKHLWWNHSVFHLGISSYLWGTRAVLQHQQKEQEPKKRSREATCCRTCCPACFTFCPSSQSDIGGSSFHMNFCKAAAAPCFFSFYWYVAQTLILWLMPRIDIICKAGITEKKKENVHEPNLNYICICYSSLIDFIFWNVFHQLIDIY